MPILGLETTLEKACHHIMGKQTTKLQHIAEIGHRKRTKSFLQSTRIGTSSLFFNIWVIFPEKFGLSFFHHIAGWLSLHHSVRCHAGVGK